MLTTLLATTILSTTQIPKLITLKRSIFSVDPCDDFDCHIEIITADFCTIPIKGPYDVNCYIPCRIDNCTKEIQPGNTCYNFICEPKPGPSPPPTPGPTPPPPPGPTPPPPPGPTPTPPPGPTPTPGPTPPPGSHDAILVAETAG